jgi:hypothetical protein
MATTAIAKLRSCGALEEDCIKLSIMNYELLYIDRQVNIPILWVKHRQFPASIASEGLE